MSQAARIDGLQFARGRESLSGGLELGALPRLSELGCRAARIDYTVRGEENKRGRLGLSLTVTGDLVLECQRCLGPMDHAVHLAVDLELASSQAEVEGADDDIDRVVAGPSMDVAALVEDELILALPMAPVHGHCGAGVAVAGGGRETSPFARLAGLKTRGSGSA